MLHSARLSDVEAADLVEVVAVGAQCRCKAMPLQRRPSTNGDPGGQVLNGQGIGELRAVVPMRSAAKEMAPVECPVSNRLIGRIRRRENRPTPA